MNIQEELNKLAAIMDSGSQADDPAFQNQMAYIKAHMSDSEKQVVHDFIAQRLDNVDKMVSELEQEIDIRRQINEISDILSMSYIAKHYFGKSKEWLYQRINGNVVNGKIRRFTKEEVEEFNFAIQDITQKLGSFRLSC